jgi:phenylalanyl-tRNA synthetase beta chain
MSYNISYKNSIKPIFEIQKIYQKHRIGIKNITLLTPENIYLDKINNSRIVYNVNGLKGIINQIVSIFNAKVSYKVESNQYFYDNECISIIYENKIIGYIGLIKKSLLKNYNINEKIYAATIN